MRKKKTLLQVEETEEVRRRLRRRHGDGKKPRRTRQEAARRPIWRRKVLPGNWRRKHLRRNRRQGSRLRRQYPRKLTYFHSLPQHPRDVVVYVVQNPFSFSLRRTRLLNRGQPRRRRHVAASRRRFFADGSSGEALDHVHEVAGGDVDDFGGDGVDYHRFPLL